MLIELNEQEVNIVKVLLANSQSNIQGFPLRVSDAPQIIAIIQKFNQPVDKLYEKKEEK